MSLYFGLIIYVIIGAFVAALIKAYYSVELELKEFKSPEGFLMFLGALWPLSALGIIAALSFKFFYGILTTKNKEDEGTKY